MALAYDGAIQRLIDAFANLPGIGPKGAQRIAFYLLNAPDEESQALIDAITEVKEKVRFCDICGNVCETSPCPVCADPRRDHSAICVVEEPKDVMSIERTREYRGMYHVLGGVINPMANVQPSDLNIAKLLERLKDSEVKEVILALNPNVEGEATTSFLSQLLSQTDIKVTRLASGLPVGGDLEYELRWHGPREPSVPRPAHTQPLSSNVFRMLGAVGLDKMDVSYNRLHLPNQAGDTLKKIG